MNTRTSLLLLLAFAGFCGCQYHDSEPQCAEGLTWCVEQCRECCQDKDCNAGEVCCYDYTCNECCDVRDCDSYQVCCANSCVDCCGDRDCEDINYCNGAESCYDGTCHAGAPVDCDDGVPCTVDYCDEASRSCINNPDRSLCPSGYFCDPVRNCLPSTCQSDMDCGPVLYCCWDDRCHECCLDYQCGGGEFCNPDFECEPDTSCDNCPPGWRCCNDGECHECCIDDDCLGLITGCSDIYIICNDDYLCECICYNDGEDCSRDPGACCAGLSCDIFTNTCMPECTADADCHNRIDVPFPEDLVCKNGVCDYNHCTSDNDCTAGTVCYDGNCITPPGCSEIVSCRVSPAHAVLETGTTVQLAADAYLLSGGRAPGVSFNWQSANSAVASVSAGGLVTGGATTGSAVITATVAGCSTSCQATVDNHGAVQSGRTRVLVVDELAGTPVQGATVVVGSESPVTTGADGSAEFLVELSASNPADVTVSKTDYEYVTFREVESSDVIIHARKIYHLTPGGTEVAGGIRGAFNFDMVRCEPPNNTCDVRTGISGLSFPGSLALLAPHTLIGNPFRTTVELGGSQEDLPFPEGLVMGLNQTFFKRHYTPTGVPGRRVAWGLGGKTDLADLIDVLGPIISGGDEADPLMMALLLMPFAFTHNAVMPGAEVVAIPTVLDVDDLNFNQQTDDTVPDYARFPTKDMILKVPANQLLTFLTPQLQVGTYDTVLVAAGVIGPGTGFVPLGMSAGMDSVSSSDPPDGVIDDPIEIRVAEVAGRLDETGLQRVVIALAFNQETPGARAGQVFFVSGFNITMTTAAFMLPPAATYNPTTRTLNIVSLPAGTDLAQAIVADAQDRNWHLFTDSTGPMTLPPAPPQGDRSEKASVIAIDLAGSVTYQDLPDFNDTNLGDLATLVGAFSFTEVQ